MPKIKPKKNKEKNLKKLKERKISEKEQEEKDLIGKIRKIKINKILPKDDSKLELPLEKEEDSIKTFSESTFSRNLENTLSFEPQIKENPEKRKEENSLKYSVDSVSENKKYLSQEKMYDVGRIFVPRNISEKSFQKQVSNSLRESASYPAQGFEKMYDIESTNKNLTRFDELKEKNNSIFKKEMKYTPSEY